MVVYRLVTDLSSLTVGDQLVIASPEICGAMEKHSFNEWEKNRDTIFSHFISCEEVLIDAAFVAQLVLEGATNAWLLKDKKGNLTTKNDDNNELFTHPLPKHSKKRDLESYPSITLSGGQKHHQIVFDITLKAQTGLGKLIIMRNVIHVIS